MFSRQPTYEDSIDINQPMIGKCLGCGVKVEIPYFKATIPDTWFSRQVDPWSNGPYCECPTPGCKLKVYLARHPDLLEIKVQYPPGYQGKRILYLRRSDFSVWQLKQASYEPVADESLTEVERSEVEKVRGKRNEQVGDGL